MTDYQINISNQIEKIKVNKKGQTLKTQSGQEVHIIRSNKYTYFVNDKPIGFMKLYDYMIAN